MVKRVVALELPKTTEHARNMGKGDLSRTSTVTRLYTPLYLGGRGGAQCCVEGTKQHSKLFIYSTQT